MPALAGGDRQPSHVGQLPPRLREPGRAERGGPHNVAEDGAGLHRGQLFGVAHQNQPGIAADRLQ
jgi:hypothetical protein